MAEKRFKGDALTVGAEPAHSDWSFAVPSTPSWRYQHHGLWETAASMARTQAVTILFCDMVASTERRARLGDDAFDQFCETFIGTLREAIAHAGGREVLSAGDGLMVVFSESVADAVSCAIEMHRSVAGLDLVDPPQLRVGISCGEVAQDGDQYQGMPIVEAARLEAAAQPGQTLASQVIGTLVGTRRAFRFRTVGALALKGIPRPLETIEVVDDEVADIPIGLGDVQRSTAMRRWPLLATAGVVLTMVVVIAVIAV